MSIEHTPNFVRFPSLRRSNLRAPLPSSSPHISFTRSFVQSFAKCLLAQRRAAVASVVWAGAPAVVPHNLTNVNLRTLREHATTTAVTIYSCIQKPKCNRCTIDKRNRTTHTLRTSYHHALQHAYTHSARGWHALALCRGNRGRALARTFCRVNVRMCV